MTATTPELIAGLVIIAVLVGVLVYAIRRKS